MAISIVTISKHRDDYNQCPLIHSFFEDLLSYFLHPIDFSWLDLLFHIYPSHYHLSLFFLHFFNCRSQTFILLWSFTLCYLAIDFFICLCFQTSFKALLRIFLFLSLEVFHPAFKTALDDIFLKVVLESPFETSLKAFNPAFKTALDDIFLKVDLESLFDDYNFPLQILLEVGSKIFVQIPLEIF